MISYRYQELHACKAAFAHPGPPLDSPARRDGRTATLRARLTLHQVRYLLAFVSRALRPRD
jgi:hypothetical protein